MGVTAHVYLIALARLLALLRGSPGYMRITRGTSGSSAAIGCIRAAPAHLLEAGIGGGSKDFSESVRAGLRASKIAIANRRDSLSQKTTQKSPSPAKLQWGRFFLEKSQKESQLLAIFRHKEKSQGSRGGGEGHFWAQKSLRFFTCVRRSQSQSQKHRDTWCNRSGGVENLEFSRPLTLTAFHQRCS